MISQFLDFIIERSMSTDRLNDLTGTISDKNSEVEGLLRIIKELQTELAGKTIML